MDPFYELCKRRATGGGLNPGEVGDVYRTVLYQRGFGMNHEIDLGRTHGLGFADGLLSLFKAAVPIFQPALSAGVKMLGNHAVTAAANIARDALSGENLAESANKRIGEVAQSAVQDIFARAGPHLMSTRGKKRRPVSHSSAGKLVASARSVNKRAKRGRGQSALLTEFPALGKLR